MDLDEDEDTQEAINASLHDMSVNEKASQEEEDSQEASTSRSSRRKKRGRGSESENAPKRARAEDVEDLLPAEGEGAPDLSIAVPVPVSAEKAARFQELLNKAFMEKREQSLQFGDVKEAVNSGLLPSEQFSDGEIKSCLERMEESNMIMTADDSV